MLSADSIAPLAAEIWIPCTHGLIASTSSLAIASPSAPARRVRSPQAVHHRRRYAYAGHLVGHVLGVPEAVERHDSGDDRNAHVGNPAQERRQLLGVE